MEAESGVMMQLQVKKCQQPPEAWGGKERILRASRAVRPLQDFDFGSIKLILDFWFPKLLDNKFHCSKQQSIQ